MKFTSHHFLILTDKDLYAPRYDVLRVYFIARFLAKSLAGVYKQSERSKIAKTLALNSTGKTQVIDWLVKQLERMDRESMHKAFNHAVQIINEQTEFTYFIDSGKALFNLIKHFITETDKELRKKQLLVLLGINTDVNKIVINKLVMTGVIKSIEFSDIRFIDCILIDVEFKNCRFNSNTEMYNCTFNGTLNFTNCDDESLINLQNPTTSREAEYTWSVVKSKVVGEDLKKAFAEDALKRALKKFKGDYSFETIQYAYKGKSFKPGNPYNELVWDVLLECKIVETHNISNVTGGGINIVYDKEIRREVTAYLDNTVLGNRLRAVIDKLIS